MVRWRMLVRCFTALMKDGTLLAAWKRGGYCWVRMSPSSELPYFGLVRADAMDVWGLYRNKISCPVEGWMRGGRKVASEWGRLKVRCSTWWPILDNACTLPGLVKVFAVKLMLMRRKSLLVRRLQHAELA